MTDDLDIPDFLRRADTPEQRARIARLTVSINRPRIKNPPKKASRRSKLLGPAFGTRIKGR